VTKNKPPIPRRLYSIKHSAEYLDMGVHGARNLIWTRQLPCVRIGRKQFVDIRDLDAFVERNKR
jgi:hypothetical protein